MVTRDQRPPELPQPSWRKKVSKPLPFALVGMFLILFTLKLAGPLAAASWWWIACPLWAPFVIFAPVLCLTIIALGVAAVLVALASWVADRCKR
jgi:hypothetical protein